VFEERLAGGAAGDGQELVAEVHELQVEMAAGSRPGIRADTEALVVDVEAEVGADDIDEEEIASSALVVRITEIASEVEAVEVGDAGDVAGADPEEGAGCFVVGGRILEVSVVVARAHEPLDMGEEIALRGVVGVGEVDADAIAVVVGDDVEIGVAAAAAEGGQDLAVPAEEIHHLEDVVAG